MVILRTRNKITDFLMISAWASPFNRSCIYYIFSVTGMDICGNVISNGPLHLEENSYISCTDNTHLYAIEYFARR